MIYEDITLGPVRLILGDCLKIAPTLEGVDAVITDPPYEIVAGGGGIGATRAVYQKTEGFTDCGFDYGILAGFRNWVCFGTLKQVPKLIDAAGKRRHMLITWNKPNPCPLVCGNYLPDTEYIVHAWEAGCLYGSTLDKARFIVHPVGDKEEGSHPNEKPVRVMTKVVKTASDRGHLILDPFMGSGTTLIAAIRTGRRAIGIEIDPTHYRTAVERVRRELAQPTLQFEPQPQPKQEPLL
jgi:DNA modification methylase